MPCPLTPACPPACPRQVRNIALCSQLQEVHRSLAGLLPRLPASAALALAPAMEAVQGAAVEAVAPLFKSAMEGLEERVLAMHKQVGGLGLGAAGAAGSWCCWQVVHTCCVTPQLCGRCEGRMQRGWSCSSS